MADAFTVDSTQVVHETIEDETILIQLRTGLYYSLTGSGPEIWDLLAGGATIEAATSALRDRYPEARDRIDAEVARLAEELLEEKLLQPANSNGRPTDSELPARPGGSSVFQAPELKSYSDMEYFLLLDPVHEVDETAGWPDPAAKRDAN